MNVLISSLGESPAVVTETVDALVREENVKIDRVITIGTSEWSVELSQDALREEFQQLGITYIPDHIEAQELLTDADHVSYLNRVATWLRTYQGQDVYLSLSGGRKTMSAVMTIAAQIYCAKMLCHVIPLDDELERLGEIRTWSNLPQEAQQYILHPPMEKVRLVRLPLLSLFPMLDDFLRALHGQADTDPRALQLLENSHLVYREGGQLKRTPSGEQMFSVLQDIAQLPPPSPQHPDEKQISIPDHGYGGKRPRVEMFARKLTAFPWTVSVQTIPYGRKPRTEIRAVHDDGRIEFDVKTGEFSAGLEIRTTAQTRGQTERVARELATFLRPERLYLQDILDACDLIRSFLEDIDEPVFMSSELHKAAVLQKLTVIGEAAARLPQAFCDQHPQIERRDIVAFHNEEDGVETAGDRIS